MSVLRKTFFLFHLSAIEFHTCWLSNFHVESVLVFILYVRFVLICYYVKFFLLFFKYLLYYFYAINMYMNQCTFTDIL